MRRYLNQPNTTGSLGERMYTTTKYQKIPLSFEDTFVITTIGDRLDTLAKQFYSDSTLWWVISMANDQLDQSSYYVEPGIQLRIPTNIVDILSDFNELNKD